jgi:hypothetical protein
MTKLSSFTSSVRRHDSHPIRILSNSAASRLLSLTALFCIVSVTVLCLFQATPIFGALGDCGDGYTTCILASYTSTQTTELESHNGFTTNTPNAVYGDVHVNFTLSEASVVVLTYQITRTMPTSTIHGYQVVAADEFGLIQSADTAVRAGNFGMGTVINSAPGFMVLSLNAGDHSYYLRYRSSDNLSGVDSEDKFFTVETFSAIRLADVNIHTQNYHNPSPSFTLSTTNTDPASNVWPDSTASITVSEATPTLIRFRYSGDVGSFGRSCGFGSGCSAISNSNRYVLSVLIKDNVYQTMGRSIVGDMPWGYHEFMQVENLAAGTYNYEVRYRTSGNPSYFPDAADTYLGMTILQFPTGTVVAALNPTTAWTIAATSSWTAVDGLTETFTLDKDDMVLLQYQLSLYDTINSDIYMTMFVDGVEVVEMRTAADAAVVYPTGYATHFMALAAGSHTIEVRYQATQSFSFLLGGSVYDWIGRSMSAIALNTTISVVDTDTIQNGAVTCVNNVTEPAAPTSSARLDGIEFVLNVNYSGEFSSYFNVSFPDSDVSGYCDFSSVDVAGNAFWNVTSDADLCMNYLELRVPINAMLANCGFSQDNDREAGRTHMLNTLSLLSGQERIEKRDDDRELIRIVSRETQFSVDVSISTNVTAVTSEIMVSGVPVRGAGLKDLTIVVTPDGNEYDYTVQGQFITDVQFPYRLEEPVVVLGDMFLLNSADLSADTHCDTVDGFVEDQVCVQVWSFTAQIDPAVACVSSDFLSEWVNVTFSYNCSDVFEGECAPSFAESAFASFYLYSAEFCPEFSDIPLSADLTLYAYEPSGGSSASTPASDAFLSTAQNAPSSDFVEEAVFVYESTVFGEVLAIVPDAAATLGSTKILLIDTIPDDNSYSRITVYNDLQGAAVGVSGGNVMVNNTGFGLTEEQPSGDTRDYADARARFQFDWNANTADRDNTVGPSSDARAGFSISVLIEVTFAPGSLSSYEGSEAGKELLDSMHADEHSKTARTRVNLYADGDGEPREFSTVSRATVSGISGSSGPGATASSGSAFTVSPTVVAGGVAGIVLVAVVAFVVFRRPEPASASAKSSLPTSSSGVELYNVGTTPNMSNLASVHDMYANQQQHQLQQPADAFSMQMQNQMQNQMQ